MQNTTQEGAHGTQTCMRRGFRELADDCNVKVTYHNNQVNELSKRLEDSQSLYNMSDCLTLADVQNTVDRSDVEVASIQGRIKFHEEKVAFFTRVSEIVATGMEHSEHARRSQEERRAMMTRHELERQLYSEARRQGEEDQAQVHRSTIFELSDDLSVVSDMIQWHAQRSKMYLRRAAQLLEAAPTDTDGR